jgi:hypothetical protein
VIFESTVDILCISGISGLEEGNAAPVIFESRCSLDSIERSAAPVIFESKCSLFQTSLDSIERSAAPVIFKSRYSMYFMLLWTR